jgi:hypothetical protein
MSDSITTSLRRLVEAFVGRRLDHLALYPAVVVQQRSDGTLDLSPEDPRVPSCQGVPIRLGIPGVTVTVPSGGRVLLGYANGDPSRPYASLWESGTVTRITINGGTAKVARLGDATNAHTHTVVISGSTYVTSAEAPTIATGSDVLKIP